MFDAEVFTSVSVAMLTVRQDCSLMIFSHLPETWASSTLSSAECLVGGQKLAPMVGVNAGPAGWFERYVDREYPVCRWCLPLFSADVEAVFFGQTFQQL